MRPSSVRATYDVVAQSYAERITDELRHKPLDRALLDAVLAMTAEGVLADVGCGPGHVTRWLARRGRRVVGVDLSPAMLYVGRRADARTPFVVGSMLELPLADASVAGAVAMYSIIHLDDGQRAAAFSELARVLAARAPLLVSFHVDGPGVAAGGVNHLTSWFGHDVDIDGYFLEPEVVRQQLAAAGLAVIADLRREPDAEHEYFSRRCYLLARR